MKRLIMLAVLAGSSLCPLSARAGDPLGQPQMPMPITAPQAPAYPGYVIPKPISDMPCAPTGAAHCPGASCAGHCGNQKNFFTKMKDWICYCPKAGDALPKLHVHPYVGPYCGTFFCTPTPGSGCASACNSAGNCNGCGTAKAPRCSGGVCQTGTPMTGPGFNSRGCQGPSTTAAIPAVEKPMTGEANDSAAATQTVPVDPDATQPISLPQPNPGTVETPEVGHAPQSRLIAPENPIQLKGTITTADHLATSQQTEQAVVASVEFRAVRIEAYFPREVPEKEFVGAVLIAKQLMTPMQLLSRP